MARIITFLKRMLTTFLRCTKPASKVENPKCIMKTRQVATNIHKLLAVKSDCIACPSITIACLGYRMKISDEATARTGGLPC